MADAPEQPVFLSSMPASARDRRLALIVAAISLATFAVLAPFAKTQLPPVVAFIPIYQSMMLVTDLITAALLFGQFSILRTRAMLALSAAYLFTAFLTVYHALSFPGLFAPSGILGGGSQTTAWLYMFWHAGFPLFVIAYAFLKPVDARRGAVSGSTPAVVTSVIAMTLLAASLLALAATSGHDAMPAIMIGNRYTGAMIGVVGSVWVFSLSALVVLWRQKKRTILDLWLMVSLFAWLLDIALSAALNQGRYDLGFYTGRAYGLAAASFVLLVLLLENVVLHHRLAKSLEAERREHGEAQRISAELAAANKELEAFAYSVSHDLRAPLRAVDGYAQILEEDYRTKLDDEALRRIDVLRRNTRNMGQLIDDLLSLSRLARQPLVRTRLSMDELVTQTLEELSALREGREVEVKVDPLGQARGDPVLVKQILVNLLSNALKFTSERRPATIEVGTRHEPDGTQMFYVKDNGAGFDMQYAAKLFGLFQRLHRTDEYEGTGVGLAIVQRLVQRHGGRVWADARPGEGATFFFTLGK